MTSGIGLLLLRFYKMLMFPWSRWQHRCLSAPVLLLTPGSGKCTTEHDSKNTFTPSDHAEQHPKVVPQLRPLGSGAAQGKVVLCCQGSSLCFGCSVGSSLGSSVLCFCTAAIALDVLFAMDTWSSGSLTSALDLAKYTLGVSLLTSKVVSFLIKSACVGALVKSTLVFVFLTGAEGDPGYCKPAIPYLGTWQTD